MVEYIESEMTDNAEYDETAIMDETQKYIAKSKALVPLRPISMQDGTSYFSQWPMTNLRAREAERALRGWCSYQILSDHRRGKVHVGLVRSLSKGVVSLGSREGEDAYGVV